MPMSYPLWVIGGAAVLVIGWVIGVFNALVLKRNLVKNAWADIDVQLKRRYDLVPNLVAAVKGYSGYEASVLEKVTEARARALTAQGTSKASAENELSGALKSLFAVAENYPDLKASANFQELQTELSSLENDIQSARRYYNAAVRELNTSLQSFPQNIVGSLFGFRPSDFFGALEDEKAAVSVGF